MHPLPTMASTSGEVEYPEFVEIMTTTLAKMEEKKEEGGQERVPIPFALLATAYRQVERKGGCWLVAYGMIHMACCTGAFCCALWFARSEGAAQRIKPSTLFSPPRSGASASWRDLSAVTKTCWHRLVILTMSQCAVTSTTNAGDRPVCGSSCCAREQRSGADKARSVY